MYNIVMDLTYQCNLSCKWCNKLCGTEFSSPDFLSIKTVREYIPEILSYLKSKPQSTLCLAGGEPTLHPQFFEILDLLLLEVRPEIKLPIVVVTNGVGEAAKILDEIKRRFNTASSENLEVELIDTLVNPNVQVELIISKARKLGNLRHHPIFRAPIDLYPHLKEIENDDFYKTCFLRKTCGSVFITPYGVYICLSAAPLISTIFKLGQGLDHFPSPEEEHKQGQRFCRYCWIRVSGEAPRITSSFERAIEKWKNDPYFIKPLE